MCTNFKLKPAQDGTVCVGRTMEFPDVIPWELGVVAPGEHRSGVGERRWTSVHGIVGMSGFGEPTWLADGLNTAGLTGHLLYMPDHAFYADPVGDGSDIGILEVVAFLLGTCATVEEAKVAVAGCNVVDQRPPQVPVPLPMHIVLHDRESCAVVELHPEGMRIVDNPVQVVTNAVPRVAPDQRQQLPQPDAGQPRAGADRGRHLRADRSGGGLPWPSGRRELAVAVPPGAGQRHVRHPIG